MLNLEKSNVNGGKWKHERFFFFFGSGNVISSSILYKQIFRHTSAQLNISGDKNKNKEHFNVKITMCKSNPFNKIWIGKELTVDTDGHSKIYYERMMVTDA